MTWTGGEVGLLREGLRGVTLLAILRLNPSFDRGSCIDEGESHLGEGVIQVGVLLAIADGLSAAISDLRYAGNFLMKVEKLLL